MVNNADKKRKIKSAECVSLAPLEVIVYFENGSVETFTKSKMERELSADQIAHVMRLCKEDLD